ncbi:MAG TPA: hypothetical protein VGS19_06015, partial [Streptosporangiaceae bacterium]|nr:hypothetical protein [Streptosporangiaceae bacterium]
STGPKPGAAKRLPGKTFSRGAPRAAASTARRPQPTRLRLGTRHSLTSRHRGDGLVGGGVLSGGTASRAHRRQSGLAPGKTFRVPRRSKYPVGSAVRFLTRRKSGGTRLAMGTSRGPRFRSSSPWAQRRGWRARLGRRRTSWRPSGGRTGGLT